MLKRRAWLRNLAVALAAVVLAVPARAAEVDRFLPEDTEVLVNVNVRQLLDSALVKKYGLEAAKDALGNVPEATDVLKDLGLDPFKDVERVLIASPGGDDQDKGLIIVHGQFDLAKFKAKGEEAAKNNGDILKIHKQKSGAVIYEVKIPDKDEPLFVALASKNTLLASPGKDYVVDALKKADGKEKPALKNKEMQALLEKMDAKQSLSLAVVGSALTKGNLAEGDVKDVLEKIEAIGGGLTIADDIKLEVVVNVKNTDTAKELSKKINEGLTQGLGVLALLAAQQKELAPVLEIVKTMKTTAKDKLVTIKAEVSADIIEKALKKN